ncbi:peptidase C65 Otubain-domain-containing protein [Dipodascopsis tothii]|uniref:peptidase C65 Otubain-domain-containing protein n=1 Tax=Dipodascopsis tothii TaxID=44089 RepID=UPI0034CD2854
MAPADSSTGAAGTAGLDYEIPAELDDASIMRLTQNIKDEEAAKHPLVGDLRTLDDLLSEYVDDTYRAKINSLKQDQTAGQYRPVRGDGNCAWRAFAYRYFEMLIGLPADKIAAEAAALKARSPLLLQAGYEEIAYEEFLEETFALFERLPTIGSCDAFLADFNNVEVSSAIIVHLRLLTAAYIKTHVDDYMPFIDEGEGVDISEYCSRHIEAFAVEADHLALSALVNVIGRVDLRVVYMDRSYGDTPVTHDFSPMEAAGDLPKIELLYRPGHYDIFYA